MSAPIRWGILGTGAIAHNFAKGLAVLDDAALVAVGSRAQETADAFGQQFDVPRRHGSYEALAADGEVDVVYIATPHPCHEENTLLCLERGKAVLCEKPFAVNARQAWAMIDRAREKKLFLMEAMWTRFLPAIVRVREWLHAGAIGEPRLVTADFGFRCGWDPQSRLLNPDYAGGGLLDVGIYVLAFANMVFGPEPRSVTGAAHLGETGVDEQAVMSLAYAGGGLASLSCAVRTPTPHTARIDGTEGRITIPAFWHTTTATLEAKGQEPETVEIAHGANGYEYEAVEVMRCLREGRTESEIMPLDETLVLAKTMDELRRQWNLHYPMEA